MKTKLLFFLHLFIISSSSAQLVNWAHTGGGFGDDEVNSISVLPSGTSYIGGSFYSPCSFDTIQLSLPDTIHAFVAKISETGNTMWVKYFPAPGNSFGTVNEVAAAGESGCYMTGYWTDSLWIDTTLLINDGSSHSFFSRLDKNGSVLWAKQAFGTWNTADNVSTNSAGEVYFTGNYIDSMTIDTISIISTFSGAGSFIAKFDSSGTLIWLKNIEGVQVKIGDISIDINQSVVVTGWFDSNCLIDSISLGNGGGNSIFIVKFSNSGQLLWVRQDGGNSSTRADGISICSNNDILITGNYSATSATFDTITIPYLSGDDFSGFLARYDENGNIKWVNYQSSIQGDVWSYVVKEGASAKIYFSGFYYDTLVTSNGGLTETGPASFVASCDADGNMLWIKKFPGGDFNFDFSIDSMERIYAAGIFRDSIVLSPYQYFTQGQADFFYAQLDASTVGISQSIGNNDFVVSPNPSSGRFFVTQSDNKFKDAVLEVYNNLGILVMQQKIEFADQAERIEFVLGSNLKSGLYILVLRDKEMLNTKRVILSR